MTKDKESGKISIDMSVMYQLKKECRKFLHLIRDFQSLLNMRLS